MKVLFKDRRDETPYCLDVSEVMYYPETETLTFYGYGHNSSEVSIKVDAGRGCNLVRLFFNETKGLDLSPFSAYINEEPEK